MTNTPFKDQSILVVGGAGFVGSNLVHSLLEQDPKQIIIVDNLLSSDISNVPLDQRVNFVFGSITDERILADLPDELDYVFHLACYHGNQSSIHNPLADHDNNTLTSLKLFDRLSRIKTLKKVVYAAAACAVAEKTYDDPTATTEEHPVTLFHDSPYSISKIIGELYGNYYFQRYDLPFVKARFSNVYGPREILGAGQWRGTIHTVYRNVIPTFVWKSIHSESLSLDNGGNTSRDFIFVEDMARGLQACAEKGTPGDVYNLATGKDISILELANIINELTGNTQPFDIRPARSWDRSGKRYASVTKSQNELGFTASVPLHQGLKKTVQWMLINKDLISSNINKHSKLIKQLSDNTK